MNMSERGKRRLALLITALSFPLIYKAAERAVSNNLFGLEQAAKTSAVISYGSLKLDDVFQKKLYHKFDDIGLVDEAPYVVETTAGVRTPQEEKRIIKRPQNAGNILRKTYSVSESQIYIKTGLGFVKNCTSVLRSKVAETVSKQPKFKIKADGTPEVLIMHTHATESYQEDGRSWFDREYSFRTTDCEKNMVRVGDEIEKQLKSAGIGVIHDKTLHDYPSYNGSYERSAETVKRILAENPAIKVVLDVHRDAIQPDSDTVIAPVCEINGEKAAQIMIISGCDDGSMNMPNYLENLKFSGALQRELCEINEDLARPVLFDYRKYNQDLTTGSILVEVGGHGNSLDEAVYSGRLLGEALVSALEKLR